MVFHAVRHALHSVRRRPWTVWSDDISNPGTGLGSLAAPLFSPIPVINMSEATPPLKLGPLDLGAVQQVHDGRPRQVRESSTPGASLISSAPVPQPLESAKV